MTSLVAVEIDDAVATIRLQRPPMNALNTEMQDGLRAAAAQLGEDDSVRAVVIYGGPKVFAAGADIRDFDQIGAAEMGERATALSAAFDAVAAIPKPVIAAVTGYALGGGCELALCADRRISADDAKWGQPEILLGLIPGAGGTQRLPRLIGPARAKDLIFTGRFVDAQEALAMGLVDEVVAPRQVYATALSWARQFAAGPALALRAAKAAIDRGLDAGLAAGLQRETELFAGLFGTEDKRIGVRSFLENGPGHADFIGR